MKSIIKFMIASSMIVGGALVIGTIFTTKKMINLEISYRSVFTEEY